MTKAVIMAGGKGTRIASVTNDEIPKPMLAIGDKPILEHQIECLRDNGVRDIIMVIGHLGNKISEYFGDGKKWDVNINYIEENEDKPLGTAGSLYFLKGELLEDFVLVFGDVFFDVDFERMMGYHREHGAIATLLTHPNSHPFDSDLVIIGDNNVVTGFDSKENDRSGYDYRNLVNSGIYILSPKALDVIDEPIKLGLEKDVIAKFIDDGKVYSYHSTEYVKDMGTPERYETVNNDYAHGVPEARNLKNKQKCIFLDRDGTINEYCGLLKRKDDLVLIDGAAEAIKIINGSEYLCIVVTNQPVIARGDISEEDLREIHDRLETLLGREGAYIDGLYYCPHHPDSGYEGEVRELKFDCECRKPKIGMVEKAAKDYNIELKNSYMIGDTWRDIEIGNRANMTTCWLECGEDNDGAHDIKASFSAENLLDAVNKIIKERK